VRLYNRPGKTCLGAFPLTVEAVAKLPSRSCIIDGEAVACGDGGLRPSIASDNDGMTRASVLLVVHGRGWHLARFQECPRFTWPSASFSLAYAHS
jgi:hypothetical protein